MEPPGRDLPELRDLGTHLLLARLERGFSQDGLAKACRLSQTQVSLFETGRRRPSLDQFMRLARALDVPLQRLLNGQDRPGVALKDLAVELRRLGAVDLWLADAAVPGAARRPEEVIALAVSGGSPDPRVIEALPALMSWNEIDPGILQAHGNATGVAYRLAWLADIALAVDRQRGFPGGCRREWLERFLKMVGPPRPGAPWDDLGRPGESVPRSPVWRRWKIRYGAKLDDFHRRALTLAPAREPGDQWAKVGRARARLAIKHREEGMASNDARPERSRMAARPQVGDSRKGRTDGR